MSKAISTSGVQPAEVAEAMGLTSDELQARLSGEQEFTIGQLVSAHGLLRVPTADLAGVA